MLYDRATIHVEAGAGGNGCVSFRREAHVPRAGRTAATAGAGATWCWSPTPGCATSPIPAQASLSRAARRPRRGQAAPRRRRRRAELTVPPGTTVEDLARGVRHDLAPGPPGGRGTRRCRRIGQQAVCDLHPAGAPVRRARRARRGGDARAAPEAARGRRPRGAAERRQVVPAAAPDPRATQGRRLSVHDARASARHAPTTTRGASSCSPTSRA